MKKTIPISPEGRPRLHRDEALQRLALRLVVNAEVGKLPGKEARLMEAVLVQLMRRERPNILELARELNMPYATAYECYGRAIGRLRLRLEKHPLIREHLGICD